MAYNEGDSKMVNMLKPTGQSRSSFKFVEGGAGTNLLEAMINAKSCIKDLGLPRHKLLSSSGIATLCNSTMFRAKNELHLPYPGDKSKILSVTIPKLEAKGKRIKLNFGKLANTPERTRISSLRKVINFTGFKSAEKPTKCLMSVALTEDTLYILLKLTGKGLNGNPPFSAYFSLAYDLVEEEINNGDPTYQPFEVIGLKDKLQHHPDFNPAHDLRHSPFWDKENRKWIMAIVDPREARYVSIITYQPDTAIMETEASGQVFSDLAMVTTNYDLVSEVGGFSAKGKGTRRPFNAYKILGNGNMGGFGKTSTVSSITVVTNDYNYFACLDSTGSNSISSKYGAVDYYEEVTFRQEVARYFGL